MGLRFRKSIKIAPGVRVNFGKKSTGVSFGTKGARVSFNSKGRVTRSVGIPGTGLYYQQSSGLGKRPSAKAGPKADQTARSAEGTPATAGSFILCGLILLLPGLFLQIFSLPIIKILGWMLIIPGICIILTSKKSAASCKARADAEREAAEAELAALMDSQRQAFCEMLAAIPRHPIEITEDVGLAPLSPTDLGSLTYSRLSTRNNRTKLAAFVVVDVETTGLSPYEDAIVEVSALRFYDFRPVELFTTLIRPPHAIPAKAQAIHHITDEMVAGAPAFGEIAAALESFIGKSNLVGHNLPFDLGFLYRAGLDVTRPARKYYDTCELSRAANPEGSHKLQSACERYGIVMDQAHRSSADCLATGLLFAQLVSAKLGAPEETAEQ